MAPGAGKFQIFVRFNSNTNIPVQVDSAWNVRRLKEEIAGTQGVNASEIRIIFAGRELKDDLTIKVTCNFFSTMMTAYFCKEQKFFPHLVYSLIYFVQVNYEVT